MHDTNISHPVFALLVSMPQTVVQFDVWFLDGGPEDERLYPEWQQQFLIFKLLLISS
jgi:hypothetical protein